MTEADLGFERLRLRQVGLADMRLRKAFSSQFQEFVFVVPNLVESDSEHDPVACVTAIHPEVDNAHMLMF